VVEHWVIVGAGSAGCVLANRLSADSSRQVTLLDDGPELVAGAVPAGVSGPSFFAALGEPGRTHADLVASRTIGGERTLYQRGRGIGGSSVVNAMVGLRGSAELYRSWGWHDADAAWERVAIPTEVASADELGAVDRALLAADSRAVAADLTRVGRARVPSAEAYLWPVLDRPNLTVRADAAVDVITLAGRAATGVRLADGSFLAADRVVVAAGAIHSPTILLRSGIDTPGVGTGLQDHPSAVLTLQLREGVEQDRHGLAVGSHLHVVIAGNVVQLLPLNSVGIEPETAGLGALLVALMTPVGQAGTVMVNAEGQPVVDFALLSDERDVVALTAGVRFTLDVLARPAFAEIVEQVFIDDQGTPAASLATDDAIATWLRARCGDYVHASSSCAMGTVVDERGSVIGYERLSVCDASIFPTIPDTNTHLPTTMLAELMAERLGLTGGSTS